MAVAGVLLGLLFYCKITFFAVGAGAIVLALVIDPGLRRGWASAAIAFLTVCAGAFVVTGVNPARYFGDLAMAMHAQSVALRSHMASETLRANVVQLALGVALWAALVGWPYRSRRMDLQAALRLTLIVGFVACAGLAISPGNSNEGNDVPFFALAGIVLLELSQRTTPLAETSSRAARLIAFAVIVLVFMTGIARNDAASLVISFSHRHGASAASEQRQRFESTALRDFWIPSNSDHQTAYNVSRDVPARINDALRLIRANADGPERLVVLANSDPLSFALGWRPARGGALWFSKDYSFNQVTYLPADRMFGDADLVIYPITRSEDGGVDAEGVELLLQLYGPYLQEHFVETARSSGWVLLRRRSLPVNAR
jgi:hypothetical protein